MLQDHYSAPLSGLDQQMVRAVPAGGNWRDIPHDLPSRRLEQIRQSAALGEGSRSTYYGRLLWDRPAYTISTYFNRPGNGCYIHPAANRLITIREAARLQSFPDSYAFHGSLRKRCSLVGNAVPPLLAFHLAAALPKGTVVDLFAGAGGMSLGFEWAGHTPVASIDHDLDAVDTMAINRPSYLGATAADLSSNTSQTTAFKHVHSLLNGRELFGLIGGPPCQGFSTAGSCLEDDPRNRLVSVMMAWAEKLQPQYVLLENVPAMMWRRHKGVLAHIHAEFRRIGYRSECIIAHAEGYGVPQLRRRLFVLAFRDRSALAWPSPVFEICEPAFRRFQPGWAALLPRPRPMSVGDAIADLPLMSTQKLDESMQYDAPASTAYQRWARGLIQIADWMPKGDAVNLEVDGTPTLPLN